MAVINIRVNDEVKKEAESIFKSLVSLKWRLRPIRGEKNPLGLPTFEESALTSSKQPFLRAITK